MAMRKAQYGYGWDWGPRLPTVGIWRDVRIERRRTASLGGVHFYTLEAGDEAAAVAVKVEATRLGGAALSARVSLRNGEREVAAAEVSLPDGAQDASAVAYLTVPHPQLWWTHDLGEPFLYDLRVALRGGRRRRGRARPAGWHPHD